LSIALSSEPPTASSQVPVIVNKRELARALAVALPTITGYLDRFDDFPVIQEGEQGREWQFDLIAVRDFLAGKREDEERQAQARQAAVAQFALPIDHVASDPEAAQLTPQQRAALAKARQLERELARESGLLVPTADVRARNAVAITRLNKRLNSFILQLSRKLEWSQATLREVQGMARELRLEFIRDLREFGPDEQGGVSADQTEPALL
jgi:phage terminase Nu1 subunit (DNA packaging protein)